MKRLISPLGSFKTAFFMLALIGASSIFAEKALRGWQLTNNTKTDIAAAWYETDLKDEKGPRRLSLLFFRSTIKQPHGPKRRCSDPVIIAPNDSYFLAQEPPTDETKRHQLLITQSPYLLLDLLDADEKGMLSIPGIAQFDKTTHTVLEQPAEKPAQKQKELFVYRPTGNFSLALSSTAVTKGTVVDKGWTFTNKAPRPLFVGWYNYQKPDNYSLAHDQHLFSIDPEETVAVPPVSVENDENSELKLVMAFDSPAPCASDKKLCSSLDALKTYKTPWHIYDENGTPEGVPHTDTIRMINTTHTQFYGALYYVEKSGATKYGPTNLVTPLTPQMQAEIAYPEKKSSTDRQLFIADEEHKHLLKKRFLLPEDYEQLTRKSFKKTNIFNWYKNRVYAIETNLINPFTFCIKSCGGGAIEYLLRKIIDITPLDDETIKRYEKNIIEGDPAFSLTQESIAARGTHSVIERPEEKVMEQEFLKKRTEHVRKAINKLFGHEYLSKDDPVPTVALVMTGGGYRAMIETIGFLQGADDEHGGNILDCCTYMMSLSGSTWACTPLVATGLTPDEFALRQRSYVGKGGSLQTLISNVVNESPAYKETRFIQNRYGQFHGPVGLYGHALAHSLLDNVSLNGKEKHALTLSDLRTHLEDARYPLPVSVAIDPGSKEEERIWYEFTPYYMGTYQEDGGFIDVKHVGSIFHDGKPVHTVPEYPLAQYLGIWGSAFAISSTDISKETALGGFLIQAAQGISEKLTKAYRLLLQTRSDDVCSSGRTTSGTIPNYNYQRTTALDGVSSKPILHLVDGGIAKEGTSRHNFATIPALWRNADILIMCDCTGNPNSDNGAKHLHAADEEARRQRLAFPNITRSTRHKKTVDAMQSSIASLFVEKDAPLIVYIKAKHNEQYDKELAQDGIKLGGYDPDAAVVGYTKTSNFSYTEDQYDLLRGLTRSILIQSKDTIKEALEITLAQKK